MLEIRRLYAFTRHLGRKQPDRWTYPKLADKFGVTFATISKIVNGNTLEGGLVRCLHPLCTEVHDNNRYSELCPRSRAAKRIKDIRYIYNDAIIGAV